MTIEEDFDVGFAARLTSEEKQIQQNYRPIIGVHKWFARRPGSLLRALLVSEFSPNRKLSEAYFESHSFDDLTIGDPFMGGGTTLFEANRLGFNVIGTDINPMAYWVVRQELAPLDLQVFRETAETVIQDVEREIGEFYTTECLDCGASVPVKYFFWVKTHKCRSCRKDLDLFSSYLIAKNSRHTHFVLHCPSCQRLTQSVELPKEGTSAKCGECGYRFAWRQGNATRNRYRCSCGHVGEYPAELREEGPPRHRLFGMEYFCPSCRGTRSGRWFKTADSADTARFEAAWNRLDERTDLPCPDAEILDGDETKRLHRWGYERFRDMFNERQLYSLGLLLDRIASVPDEEARSALATVFSDFLRYQNMLCRYDVCALKCQDIFAVHGFPVGLVECENNVLGVPKVGSGGFRHFVEKFVRAKNYCEEPFETIKRGNRKTIVKIAGERIEARFVKTPGRLKGGRKALIKSGSFTEVRAKPGSLDGIFTDPPYFDNVQYAELMDFCYSWLRLLLKDDTSFASTYTRSPNELTGNVTSGRDLEHFTAGLSSVFTTAAESLKTGAPFVFTYHHNDVSAYVPVVVAILDAGMRCTATLAAPAEMSASLHINGTGSSVVDTVVVCRRTAQPTSAAGVGHKTLLRWLADDQRKLRSGGVRCTQGDLCCLAMGHVARVSVGKLGDQWNRKLPTKEKMIAAERSLQSLVRRCDVQGIVRALLDEAAFVGTSEQTLVEESSAANVRRHSRPRGLIRCESSGGTLKP